MQILKAYAAGSATGSHGFGMRGGRNAAYDMATGKAQLKSSGDSLSLSDEAMEMLLTGGASTLSACPQDATYDQSGHMTRQFDNLQNHLRRLASQFRATAGGAGMLGRLNTMQSQVAAIRAQV